MKLIKLSSDHYIIVDENRDINENDYTLKDGEIREVSFLMQNNGHVITHSTQPLAPIMVPRTVLPLDLLEVKELIGEIDVNKKAKDYLFYDYQQEFNVTTNDEQYGVVTGYTKGYSQALEDNKDKVYTVDDMIKCWKYASIDNNQVFGDQIGDNYISFIKSLQPKTEWDVEFIDGKLKLK